MLGSSFPSVAALSVALLVHLGSVMWVISRPHIRRKGQERFFIQTSAILLFLVVGIAYHIFQDYRNFLSTAACFIGLIAFAMSSHFILWLANRRITELVEYWIFQGNNLLLCGLLPLSLGESSTQLLGQLVAFYGFVSVPAFLLLAVMTSYYAAERGADLRARFRFIHITKAVGISSILALLIAFSIPSSTIIEFSQMFAAVFDIGVMTSSAQMVAYEPALFLFSRVKTLVQSAPAQLGEIVSAIDSAIEIELDRQSDKNKQLSKEVSKRSEGPSLKLISNPRGAIQQITDFGIYESVSALSNLDDSALWAGLVEGKGESAAISCDFILQRIGSQLSLSREHFSVDIVGTSESLMKAVSQALQFANSKSMICLYGPEGTGKRLLIEGIHKRRGMDRLVVISDHEWREDNKRDIYQAGASGAGLLVLGAERYSTEDMLSLKLLFQESSKNQGVIYLSSRRAPDFIDHPELPSYYIELVGLSERPEDLLYQFTWFVKLAADAYQRDITQIDPSVYRSLLTRRWVRNSSELQDLARLSVLTSKGPVLSEFVELESIIKDPKFEKTKQEILNLHNNLGNSLENTSRDLGFSSDFLTPLLNTGAQPSNQEFLV